MADGPLTITAPPASDAATLDDILFDCFEKIRQALVNHTPVVVVVADKDLLGHGDPVAAALAGALVGLVRALATEAHREDWQINALSVTDGSAPELRDEWIRRLSDPVGLTGELIRLGRLHLGRVPA